METILNGETANKWEALPDVNRVFNFRFTVRDNVLGGGTNNSDDVIVTSNTSYGPFEITSQNTSGVTWLDGTTETITWNVNNTNTLPGSANVNILLSTDGGLTFPTVLVANTPNDGTEDITVPNIPSPNCRILIQPTNHIFFNVNKVDFAINYTVTTNCITYSDSPNMAITDNSGSYDTTGINVPDNVSITDVNINVNITHTYLSDLLVSVLSPGGTQVDLFTRECTSNDNMNITFDDAGAVLVCATPTSGTYAPANPLNVLNGEFSNGIWTLGVNDNQPADEGTLNSWSVEICSTTTTPLSVNKFDFAEFTVYPNPSNGLLTVSLLSKNTNNLKVELFDITGRKVFVKNYPNSGSIFNREIDLNQIAKGTYILRVSNENQISSKHIQLY